jgi:glutamate synthase (ferredoxin)
MGSTSVNRDRQTNHELAAGFPGQRWLVEERDACGVGFIADQYGRTSHALVAKALSALTCLEHRGACSADQDSGDGAGIMTAIPWDLLSDWLQENQIRAVPVEHLGVGMD